MGANLCTSKTGTVTGTDPNFVVPFRHTGNEGVVLFLTYTKGTETSVTITFDSIVPSLSSTTAFRHVSLSGTTLSAYTMVLTAASMAATVYFRIPIPVIAAESTIVANITFSSSAQGGVIAAHFMEA